MKTLFSRSLFRLAFLSLLLTGLASCGSPPEQKDDQMQTLVIEISASADVNPDLEARPSPVILHMLELRAVDEFNRADYFTLMQVETSSLGGDVLNKTEIVLTPGTSREARLELNPNTAFLGFVAGYRDIDNSRWRISQVIVPGQTGRLSVTLDKHQILISEINN